LEHIPNLYNQMKNFTLKTFVAGLILASGLNSNAQVVLQNHSKTSPLVFLNRDIPGLTGYNLIGSDDTLAQSPSFKFGGSADGCGFLKNSDGTFTFITNHEDNFAVSRITFDATLKPVKGEYILNSDAGMWRLCSGTLATPDIHGFGPVYLTCGESGRESMTHAINPFAPPALDTNTVDSTAFTLARGLGRWSAENAVPFPKDAYPGKTVIVIGDDDSGAPGYGQLALYVSNSIGDLTNGNLYVLRRNDGIRDEAGTNGIALNTTVPVRFSLIPDHKTLTGAQIDQVSTDSLSIAFNRVEDIDYRKGSTANHREMYFVVTGNDNGVTDLALRNKTKWGRMYKLVFDANDPLKGMLTCVVDGDIKTLDNPMRLLYQPDNICVTNDYVYIQEDPNGYNTANTDLTVGPTAGVKNSTYVHDARIYQYDIETGNVFIVTEFNHRRGGAAYPDSLRYNNNGTGTYAKSGTGSWEYGGMIDVSDELGIDNTFLLNIQPHSWRSVNYKGVDGGTLRTGENQASLTMAIKGIPRAKVKSPVAANVTACKGDTATLVAEGGYANAEYFWYENASGGSPIYTGKEFKVLASTNKTYFVSAKALGTEGSRGTANLIIQQKPNVSLGNDLTVCGSTTLNAGNTGATYLWSDNSTAQTLEVDQTGTYIVTVTNANGCSKSDTINVTVNPNPETPSITVNGNVLTSSSATGNQWYKDGVLINGATAQVYTATESGGYTVKVTNATTGCISLRSNTAAVIIIPTGVETELANNFKLYPNPNDGKFNLQFTISEVQNVRISVTNLLGQTVYTEDMENFKGDYSNTLDLSSFANGQYYVNVNTNSFSIVKSVVKK
jgi:hypothetical protein